MGRIAGPVVFDVRHSDSDVTAEMKSPGSVRVVIDQERPAEDVQRLIRSGHRRLARGFHRRFGVAAAGERAGEDQAGSDGAPDRDVYGHAGGVHLAVSLYAVRKGKRGEGEPGAQAEKEAVVQVRAGARGWGIGERRISRRRRVVPRWRRVVARRRVGRARGRAGRAGADVGSTRRWRYRSDPARRRGCTRSRTARRRRWIRSGTPAGTSSRARVAAPGPRRQRKSPTRRPRSVTRSAVVASWLLGAFLSRRETGASSKQSEDRHGRRIAARTKLR